MIALVLLFQNDPFDDVKKLYEAKDYAKAFEKLDAMKSAASDARAWEIRLGAAAKQWPRAVTAVRAFKDPYVESAVAAAIGDVGNELFQDPDVAGRADFLGAVVAANPGHAHPWVKMLAAVGLADRDGKSDPAVKYAEEAADKLNENPKTPEAQASVSMVNAYLAYVYWKCGAVENRFSKLEAASRATFKDVTEARGLKGAGQGRVAVGDFNGDGFEDLWLAGKIYRNDGGKKFVPLDTPAPAGAALWGDLDNDGAIDLVLFNQDRPRILKNLDGKTFEEKSALPKLEAAPEGNALVDVDGDGRLDIYIAVYEEPMGVGHADKLYRNKGNFEFADESEARGVSKPAWCGRGVACADFDDDGDQDIFVANYRLNPDFLWQNNGKGQFANVASWLGVEGKGTATNEGTYFGHGIGAAWGDLDNDGDLDLVVANLAHPRFIAFSNKTTVYSNLGKAAGWKFEDRSEKSGVAYEETHSDASLVDVDNDGDLDLYLTGIYRERPSSLYQNKGDGTFEPVTWKSGAIVFDGWGHAWFDYDNDGDLDLIVCTGHGARLFENQLAGSHFIRLNLRRASIGSRIKVTAGGKTQLREIQTARGTTSQDSSIAHFGLGEWNGKVDVEIRWPDGSKSHLADLESGRTHTVAQP